MSKSEELGISRVSAAALPARETCAFYKSTEQVLAAVSRTAFFRPKHLRTAPRVLDLFAGAGGFSLGFHLAGGCVSGAVEIDEWACKTLALNHSETSVVHGDISLLTDKQILAVGHSCDIIIGGPPCQGYSVANNKAGDPIDPRNSLFREFVRAVALIRPKAVLLENVPGLLKRKAKSGEFVIDIIVSELKSLGYFVEYRVLEAQSFGVPQIRPRLFVVGYMQKPRSAFPSATHGPDGRAHDLFRTVKPVQPYVTLWEAISDLPDVEARQGAEEMEYCNPANTDYQALMRGDSPRIYNNVAMSHSARMVERFSHVRCGDSGMDVPVEHQSRKRGDYSVLSGKSYSQNNRRMHPGKPCHTIPASFYANFIHPVKDRNFTPREGARIQSFPDWYRFYGKPTVVSTKLLAREQRADELHLCQYNQIGNAVPPLLSFHLARHILAELAFGETHCA